MYVHTEVFHCNLFEVLVLLGKTRETGEVLGGVEQHDHPLREGEGDPVPLLHEVRVVPPPTAEFPEGLPQVRSREAVHARPQPPLKEDVHQGVTQAASQRDLGGRRGEHGVRDAEEVLEERDPGVAGEVGGRVHDGRVHGGEDLLTQQPVCVQMGQLLDKLTTIIMSHEDACTYDINCREYCYSKLSGTRSNL